MQNYKKICELLSSEDCKPYVNKLINKNPAQIVLQYSGKIPCDVAALAELIKLYQKAADKLPLWVDSRCALSQRSYEQSTSQLVALYKSTFIKGKKLLILGGGLGVDEWALSQTFAQLTTIDNDEALNQIVAFNYPKLAIKNVKRITQTAEEYLYESDEPFDCIYTDPDRRDEKGERKITLQQSTPDIIALLPKLWDRTQTLIVKASPLLDINTAVLQLGNVREVRVIAVKNEVKEILITAEKGFTGIAKTVAVNHNGSAWQEYTTTQVKNPLPETAPPDCFFEPNTAIIKAGLHQSYAAELGLGTIDPKTAYYTGTTPIEDFMGRQFSIINAVPFAKSGIAAYIKQHGLQKANVAKRNFRLSVDEIKKLFKIKDGGNEYLFFTQQGTKGILYHCRPV
ncbi:MAG: hypothetical protein F9K23_13130 [Bacteroidetes bacterium]|nr:MAG: hypothetical protein F9K23_13130 [Bacteroidota bacterium]